MSSLQINPKLIKQEDTILWDGDELPNGVTYELTDNIYNYKTLVFFCQWSIKFSIPVRKGENSFFGGMNYPTGAGTMSTVGINSSTPDEGNSLAVVYLRQLIHTPSGGHGSFEHPKLYQIIGQK